MDELTLQISGISVKDGKKQACVRFTDNERYAEGTIPDCVIIRSEGFTNEEKAPFQALLFVYAFSRIGWRMTVFHFSGGTLRASDR